MERQILSILLHSRKAYDDISKYLFEDDFTDQGQIIFNEVRDYYSKDPDAKAIDKDILLRRIERSVPKHFDLFKAIIESLEPSSIPNIIEEVLRMKMENVASRLSTELLKANSSSIVELMEEYKQLESGLLVKDEKESEVYIGQDVTKLVDAFAPTNLIKVYPTSFNTHLEGGVPPQTHIVVYATPETGKSLFAINAAYGFCKEGHKTLYIGNEDSSSQMLMRFINRMSLMNKYQVLKDPKGAQAKAIDNGYGNLIFVSTPNGTMHELEHYIRMYRPTCIIIDQIRHLKFPGIDGEVAQMTMAGKAVRELLKKYNLVGISVTQAGDSADGKLYLSKGDVYMSNTSLPGDADVLLGIGMNAQYQAQNRRMLTPCKNKVSARHDGLPVAIDQKLSRMLNIA